MGKRQVSSKKTGEGHAAEVVVVTRVAPERAHAVRLLTLVRGHWPSENMSVRDGPCDAERAHGLGLKILYVCIWFCWCDRTHR
jgi:hypothetical protein